MADAQPLSVAENNRLSKIIEFGEAALAADDLDELLHNAVRNVAEGLGLEHAKVLIPQDNGDLLVIAGIGWSSGVVGRASIQGDRFSPPGFALKTLSPIRSINFADETHFEVPDLLHEHGNARFHESGYRLPAAIFATSCCGYRAGQAIRGPRSGREGKCDAPQGVASPHR